ncbi:adenylyl cyclase X E [Episyrphus balteatus]|uniref:adenylyl cyclase X E n=1 Tax=Episyrphus balteatus TaxID=286459 RepID=UPI0024863456|nr:adenylyl cyclase X E [Episyrphus balteatus]XP_055841977.1 adenylyl cyclase X E [Episyrphus balteatus]
MNTILQRNSEQFRRKPTHEPTTNLYYERKWEWGFLRKQCRNLEMEQFYSTYMQRLRISYLSLFILLQALVGITHVVMLMAAVADLSAVFVEIFSYLASILLVWMVLFITFREDLIKRQPWIAYVASCTAVFILVVSDLLIPTYHAAVNFPIPPLRPSYGSYILYAIYMFMPLSDNWHATILGIAATICYMVNFAMVTYRLDDHILIKTISEAIFLGCVNLLGIYFRFMKEIAIRTTFLDRRECIEENLLLRYARDQEKSLFLSIIPAQTADKIEREVRERIEHMKVENRHRRSSLDRGNPHTHRSIKRWRRPDTGKLFIESHSEVSVLYADIVNYTHLTTTLDVKTLVETIHDLFVKFDQASEEYNVLRIKFLGDCYYCVSGVPVKNDHHAKSCVDLGLRMIKDIREVRTKRQLDIDMRIGVHSGSILSGVIGVCKWQYDIWSKDVDIANRLESTGAAGRVHVSQQTLELLDGEYMYEEGTQMAKEDEVLNKYQIRTYLIKPQRFYQTGEYKRQSIGARRRMIESNRGPKVDNSINFMQNTIEQYNQIRIQAKLEMSRELDKMPIGKFHASKICFGPPKRLTQDEMEEQTFRSNVTTICLFFKDWRWEFMYMIEPDVMLKYSILIGFITYFGILSIQAINQPQSDMFWVINALAGALLTGFLLITWYKKLWIMFNPSEEDDSSDQQNRGKPHNKISQYFYNLSDIWMRSIFARCFIYLTMVTTLCASSMLQLMDCRQFEEISQNSNTSQLTGGRHSLCFNPWAITESLVLTICMNFLFTRIPFAMKFIVGVVIVLVYSYCVAVKYAYIYHLSPSTNLGLNPEYSHLLVIFISFGIFHLMDRQTEYISKVDYNWKRQLQKKQEDAHVTNETIKILVHNILPAHVAELYMSRKMKNEHYFEEYDNVAVMFATIRNYDTEKVGLRVLNEIICDFDEKLLSYQGQLKIEKIKVAGWSYMAACGLDTNRCESTTVRASHRSSGLMPNGRRSYNTTLRCSPSMDPNGEVSPNLPSTSSNITTAKSRQRKISSRQSNNVVYVMAQFALDLMKTLHSFNVENLQCESNQSDAGMLRIGISNGEIMAGVVGSSKPHYDIWGNAVNMASRMDSTGIPGCIQVTQDTAEILMSFDIQCKFRGMTFVKGRGNIPTYFVGIDEDLNFIKQNRPLVDSLEIDC